MSRSLTLPKGTAFTCALKTKVISATSGLVGCQVQRNVFSDDGRVLLIERGSQTKRCERCRFGSHITRGRLNPRSSADERPVAHDRAEVV